MLLTALVLLALARGVAAGFDPERTRWMATSETGNVLFRGNLPEANGTFVLDELWESLRAAEGCDGTCIPADPANACVLSWVGVAQSGHV